MHPGISPKRGLPRGSQDLGQKQRAEDRSLLPCYTGTGFRTQVQNHLLFDLGLASPLQALVSLPVKMRIVILLFHGILVRI